MASENSLHRLFAGYQHKCSGRGFGERSQGSVRGAEYRLSRRLGIAWILGCCATLKTRSNFSAQCRHILSDLVVGDLGVNLGRGDMFMSQHLRYDFHSTYYRCLWAGRPCLPRGACPYNSRKSFQQRGEVWHGTVYPSSDACRWSNDPRCRLYEYLYGSVSKRSHSLNL